MKSHRMKANHKIGENFHCCHSMAQYTHTHTSAERQSERNRGKMENQKKRKNDRSIIEFNHSTSRFGDTFQIYLSFSLVPSDSNFYDFCCYIVAVLHGLSHIAVENYFKHHFVYQKRPVEIVFESYFPLWKLRPIVKNELISSLRTSSADCAWK